MQTLNTELILLICYNVVVVQISILHTTSRVIFLESISAIISLSCFKHFNGRLCPQNTIPDPSSSHEVLHLLTSAPFWVPSCIVLIPLLFSSLHFCHHGILSAPWMHQSSSSLFFEGGKIKNTFFIFSKPVQIFSPSNLSLTINSHREIFQEFQIRLEASITHYYRALYF